MSEVLGFKAIYYVGSTSIAKIGMGSRSTGLVSASVCNIQGGSTEDDGKVYNNGYDDSRGDLYMTKHDHIGYRYEILSLLGKGSFGQVIKCFDHKLKSHVALKVIRNKKRFEKQGMVEVKVLKGIRDADSGNKAHLIHIRDSFYFRGHLCLTFDLLGINLYEWLKAGSFRGVHLGVIRTYSQMLACLKLLGDVKIVHCDLKPENVLLDDVSFLSPSRSDANPPSSSSKHSSYIPSDFNPSSSRYKLKVIDFGSSCYENERLYTYVQSRFYRSPEVILGMPYRMAIDVWSFGCILAELYTGYPLFPGENEQDQLACIMEIKGVPLPSVLEKGTHSKNNPIIVANSKGKKRRPSTKTLSSVLKCTDMSFLDFIDKCLAWDPDLRMSPRQALEHPFITGARFIPSACPPDLPRRVVHTPSAQSDVIKVHLGSGSGGMVGKPPVLSNQAKYSIISPPNLSSNYGNLTSGSLMSHGSSNYVSGNGSSSQGSTTNYGNGSTTNYSNGSSTNYGNGNTSNYNLPIGSSSSRLMTAPSSDSHVLKLPLPMSSTYPPLNVNIPQERKSVFPDLAKKPVEKSLGIKASGQGYAKPNMSPLKSSRPTTMQYSPKRAIGTSHGTNSTYINDMLPPISSFSGLDSTLNSYSHPLTLPPAVAHHHNDRHRTANMDFTNDRLRTANMDYTNDRHRTVDPNDRRTGNIDFVSPYLPYSSNPNRGLTSGGDKPSPRTTYNSSRWTTSNVYTGSSSVYKKPSSAVGTLFHLDEPRKPRESVGSVPLVYSSCPSGGSVVYISR